MTTTAESAAQAPRQIKISDIIAMLEGGKTREEIKGHYNMTPGELKAVFSHPKLKGRKTHTAKATSFELIDDTENTGVATEEERPVTRTRRSNATPAAAVDALGTVADTKEEAKEEAKAEEKAAETTQAEELPQDDTADNPWNR